VVVWITRQQHGQAGAHKKPPRDWLSARRKFGVVPAAALALTMAGSMSAVAPASASTPARANITAQGSVTMVAFAGQYKGNAALLINNGSVTINSVTGKGTGTLVGASTVEGQGSSSSSAQCDPFTGTGALTGASAKITLKVIESKSSGCSSGESGPVTVTFNGVAVATGGTGKAKGASGSLKFKGTLNLAGTSGSQNGQYKVTLNGKLTVKG